MCLHSAQQACAQLAEDVSTFRKFLSSWRVESLLRLRQLQHSKTQGRRCHLVRLNIGISLDNRNLGSQPPMEGISQIPKWTVDDLVSPYEIISYSPTKRGASGAAKISVAAGAAIALATSAGWALVIPVVWLHGSCAHSARKSSKEISQNIAIVQENLTDWIHFKVRARRAELEATVSSSVVRAAQRIFKRRLDVTSRVILPLGFVSLAIRHIAGRLGGSFVSAKEDAAILRLERIREKSFGLVTS